MKLPTIPPGLAGKIVKYRPLSEPISKLSTVCRSQFACYAKFLVTRHALPANILLGDAAKKMSSKEA